MAPFVQQAVQIFRSRFGQMDVGVLKRHYLSKERRVGICRGSVMVAQ